MHKFFLQKLHPIVTLVLTTVLLILLNNNFSHQIDHDLVSADPCSFCVGTSVEWLDSSLKPSNLTGYVAILLYLSVFYSIKQPSRASRYLLSHTRAPPL